MDGWDGCNRKKNIRNKKAVSQSHIQLNNQCNWTLESWRKLQQVRNVVLLTALLITYVELERIGTTNTNLNHWQNNPLKWLTAFVISRVYEYVYYVKCKFFSYRVLMFSPFLKQLAVDLLNPSVESEKRSHKLKRLVQSPNSYFMDVKCPGKFLNIYICIDWLGNCFINPLMLHRLFEHQHRFQSRSNRCPLFFLRYCFVPTHWWSCPFDWRLFFP